MKAVVDIINETSVWWWHHLAAAALQAAAVGALLLAVVYLLGRRWPAPLRYALLVLALLKFAFPPLLTAPTGLLMRVVPPQTERKPAWACDLKFLVIQGERDNDSGAVIQLEGWLMLLHGLGTVLMGVAIAGQALR
jgi:hypothetical protein